MAITVESIRKKREELKNNSSAKTNATGGITVESIRAKREELNKERAGARQTELSSRISQWLTDSSSYIDSYNTRFVGRDNSKYVSDSKDWHLNAIKSKAILDNDKASILADLDKYGKYYDQEWVSSVREALSGNDKIHSDILTTATEDRDFWNQFAPTEEETEEGYTAEKLYGQWYTEEGYRQKYEGKKYWDLKRTLDTMEEGAEKEWLTANLQSYMTEQDYDIEINDANTKISEMEALLAKYKKLKLTPGQEYEAVSRQIGNEYGGVEELEYAIKQAKASTNLLVRDKEYLAMTEVGIPASEEYDPEFEELSVYDSSITTGDYAYLNMSEEDRAKYVQSQMVTSYYPNDTSAIDANIAMQKRYEKLDQLTEDEIAVYNYWYKKGGAEKAAQYLTVLGDTVNQRIGAGIYTAMENKPVLELAYSTVAGLDQFGAGMRDLAKSVVGDDSYEPTSALQYAGQMAREELGDVDLKWYNMREGKWENQDILGSSLGQGLYDLGSTTANMAPSILTSAAIGMINPVAGKIAGVSLLGGSAAGNGYREMINQGWSVDDARAYGYMVGAAEATLEYALGGISKLGGTAMGAISTKLLNKIDNVIGKVAKTVGGKMVLAGISEGFEEGLQSILEPYIWQAVSGEEAQVDWEETLYSSLLGFVSGGMFEGADVSSANRQLNRQYKNTGNAIVSGGQVDALKALAMDVAGVSTDSKTQKALTKQANKVTTEAKGSNAVNVGKLYDAVKTANRVNNANANQSDIVKSLTRKGFTTETATDIAGALVAAYNGQTLTKAQSKLLESAKDSKAVQEAVEKIVKNAASTMGQREQGVQSLLKDANLANIAKAANISVEQLKQIYKKAQSGELTKEDLVNAETTYNVSTDGKTIYQGDVVAVKEIASIKDGKMTLRLENGTEVDSRALSYGTEAEALVYEVVAGMGVDVKTANSLVEGFQIQNSSNLQAAADYAHGISTAFRYGMYNYSMDELSDTDAAKLSKPVRELAYNQGQKVAGKQVAKEQARIDAVYEQAKATLDKNGSVSGEHSVKLAEGISKKQMSKSQRASYDLAEQIAPAISGDILVYEGKQEWGYYDPDTDTICLNINAKWSRVSMMTFTLAHELVHRAKLGSPAKFKVFANFLVKEYGKQGSNLDAMIAEQLAAAKKAGIKMEPDQAFEEVICDACQKMLVDTDAGKKLAEFGAQSEQNRNIVEQFGQWLKELLEKLRSLFRNVEPDSLAAKEFQKFDANVKQILADMFVDMSLDAGEKLSTIKAAGMTEKITTDDGGAKMKNGSAYDYSKSFAEQVDDYKAGKIPKGDTLVVGGTPEVFRKIGMIALPMTINTTHIDYALNGTKDFDHHLGEALLKQLPEAIKKPVAIMTSGTKANSSIVAMLEIRHNGKQVVVPIVVDGFGRQNGIHIDSNAVTSVYGKDYSISKVLYDAITQEANGQFRLYYLDKNKATALLQKARVLMPKSSATSNGGFIHSIRESGSPVNMKFQDVTETQQFKRWFGDWQKHPNKASKIVNSDGTPMIMYHGSPAQFTIFDKKKAKSSGQYGRGFYFTNSQSHAGTYGQQYSVYLNIRNPLQQGTSNVSRAQVRSFLEAVAENEDYSIENYGTYDVDSVLQNIMGEAAASDAFQVIQDVSLTAIGDMVEAAELFNKVNGTKFDGIVAATETVAFEPNQIKSAMDNIGTFDGNNPDIRYKLPVDNKSVDKTNSVEENDVTQNSTRGEQYDNRGIREGIAETTGGKAHHRRATSGSVENAQTAQGWESLNQEVRSKVLRNVNNRVNNSSNATEVYNYLLSLVNASDETINVDLYKKAVGLLTEQIYNDAVNLHPVLFEDKWKIMGGSISDLRRSILDSADEMAFKLPVAEDTSPRTLLANALESTATDDKERSKIAEYKASLEAMEAEEEKLRELNAQIKELSFAKGKRDMEKIRKLRDEARKTTNRINIYDKQLLGMEAAKPLQKVLERERKKVYDRAKQKNKEAMAEYKKSVDEKFDAITQQYREQRKEAVAKVRENSAKRDVRQKILSFKKRMEQRLLRPTDTQYVPAGLAKAMVEVCELINTDTDLYKADGSINKAQERREQTKLRLGELAAEYKKLAKHSDPAYQGEFDETFLAYLEQLRDDYAGKNLSDLTLDELRDMYDILRSIEETLQDAKKLIGWGENEGVYEAGDAIVAEQAAIIRKRKNGKRNAAQKVNDASLNNSLSPMRNVERMAGYNQDSTLLKLFKKLEQGVRKKNFFTMNAYKSFEALTSQKAYEDAVYKEAWEKKFTDSFGREFGLSKMQMMQAVLSYERETANNMHHIEKGGFTFADLDMLRKGKVREAVSAENAHRVSNATNLVAEFTEILKDDAWCQEYMKAARAFFNETAKNAVNETMLALKHRIVAKDKNYIPFEVDQNFVSMEISAEQRIQQTINAYGMLKETKSGAAQPLYITGLNNIIERHIEMVGNVYGLAVEVRNFNKVWNIRSNASGHTVKEMLDTAWGTDGVENLTQAVMDIQGPRDRKRKVIYDKVKSGYIGATFMLNLSVVTKQIGSMFAATSMLNWRGPVRQMANLVRTMAKHKQISAEVDQYTATAWMRRQGLSDAELHTLMTEGKKTWLGKLTSKMPSAINPTKWITAMDHVVALSLWEYAKADVAKKTGLKGEALLKATAEFYDEVVENTQSMTDVLHRPEIQKKDGVVAESFSMFKTDLYQMAGQLHAAAGRYAANKTSENGRALGRTVYAVAMSAIWGQLMTTVFALLRYKVDPYRDEEDDLTVESWLKRQSFALVGDFMGYIVPLFGSEVVNFAENIVYGETDDVVDSIGLTAINTLFDEVLKAANSLLIDHEMPDEAVTKRLVVKALTVLGVPANNILRTLDAIKLHAEDIANGEFLSFEAGANRSVKQYMHKIVEAVDSGDADIAQGLYEETVEELAIRKAGAEYTDEDLKAVHSQLQTSLGEQYKDGQVTVPVAEKILMLLGKSDDEIYWIMDKWDNAENDDYSKYGDFLTAVKTGKNLKTVIKEYTDHGVTEETLRGQITNYFKPQYLAMSRREKTEIIGYLINAYCLLGYTRTQARKLINNWKEEEDE